MLSYESWDDPDHWFHRVIVRLQLQEGQNLWMFKKEGNWQFEVSHLKRMRNGHLLATGPCELSDSDLFRWMGDFGPQVVVN